MKSRSKLYQFHVDNLKEISGAISKVARLLHEYVSQNDENSISAFVRLYALLLGAWAECRLRKLTYEPNGFNDKERAIIQAESTQLKQWQKAVELAFRRQYQIPKAPLTASILSHSAYSRYITLFEMLESDLKSIIELRNKLAHGQWAYPLNNEGNDIAQEQMDALRAENILSLQFKKTLLETLSSAIHDLVVSKPTFERDFDHHFQLIIQTQLNLKNRDYKTWAKNMQEKYARGKLKKRHPNQN